MEVCYSDYIIYLRSVSGIMVFPLLLSVLNLKKEALGSFKICNSECLLDG